MSIYPLLRTSFICWAPAHPDDIRARLFEHIGTRTLQGTVNGATFRLSHPTGMKNSWRPQMYGTLSSVGGGTLINVTLSVHPFVAIFTLVHGLLLVGIAWVMGILAFSWEVDAATTALKEAVGATLVGADAIAAIPVADPAQPGAESHAPYLLETNLSGDGAVFRMLGRPSRFGLGAPARTPVEVGQLGVTIGGALIAWDKLARCDVTPDPDARALVLIGTDGEELARAACEGTRLEDALWLASYLASQAQRFRQPPEERARQDTERARLSTLMRSAKTDG